MPETVERPTHYPPDAVLTPDEVCAWLGVSKSTLERYGIPRIQLSPRKTRYLAGTVVEHCKDLEK